MRAFCNRRLSDEGIGDEWDDDARSGLATVEVIKDEIEHIPLPDMRIYQRSKAASSGADAYNASPAEQQCSRITGNARRVLGHVSVLRRGLGNLRRA